MYIVNLSRIGRAGTGMWNYSINFIKSLHALGLLSGIVCTEANADRLSKFEVKLVTVPDWVSNTSRVSKIRPLLWFFYSYFLSFRLFFKMNGSKIISTTHHVLPILRKQIITIHDLRPYKYPDSLLQKFFFHSIIPRALRRCCHVITVSNTVRHEIASCYSYPIINISVIYNSIDTDSFIPTTVKQPFLLAVGASWKHKNIDSFLKAHMCWFEKYKLIIVCGETSYVDTLKSYVAKHNLENVVDFRHGVPFTDLKNLYSTASALIYPSLDEGFGIPPIEAMASLTPVIVSNIPVFHEVLGDVAIYVDPEDSLSWKLALDKVPANTEWSNIALACAKKYNAELMCQMISTWLVKMKA